MKVSKKEGRILSEAITNWFESDVISAEESHKLKDSYEITSFDWERVAKYSFWLAIFCIVISISSILAEQWLIALLKKLLNAPDAVKCISFVILSGGLYFLGVKRKGKYPDRIYSNEAIFFWV